jgi:hypothetical protein
MKAQNIRQQQKTNNPHDKVPSRNKVIVVEESHATGCAEELIPHLKQHFQVCGYVKPGV